MPRTKRPKRRPPKSKQSDEIKLDPNIVIKQEPEDPPPEIMETEAEVELELEKEDTMSSQIFGVEQLQKVVAGMHKKRKQFFAAQMEKVSTRISMLKLTIPPEWRDVPIAELILKEGLTQSVSKDSLSVSQQIDGSDLAGHSVEQMDHLPNEKEGYSTGPTNGSVCVGDKFKTPACGVPTPRFGTITPKVGPDSPVTILRRPKMGEKVYAMTGSPVMLNAAREDKPTLNIPMTNGTVMSILPERGLRTAHLPQQMDKKTQEHLKTILENLKELIVNTETPKS